MSVLDTAEYRRLALIAAGVDPAMIPCILDTATWRRLMLKALYDLSQGGGGSPGYINGSVQFYADLPITVGTPAVNTAYLVRENSGVWFINRRPAGIYVRLFNNGTLDDWDYAGAFPEVNDAQYFRIYDSADPTREVAFNVSGVAAATTRTLTVPNANGTIALTADIPTTFDASAITSGTLDIARVPTGTTSTTVALGDHTHELDELAATGAGEGDLPVAQGDGTIAWQNGTTWAGQNITAVDVGAATSSHAHGNLTNDGKVGSTSGLPLVTTTAGAVTTLALGTAGQVLTVNSGANGVEFAAASGGGVTGAAASASDVLGVSGSDITGVDANADRIVFWDDSASELTYLATVGPTFDGTTLRWPVELVIACSDESTNLTTGTAKVTFRAPYAFTLTGVRASVNTAPTGSTLIVDINEGGTSVLSTKLSIDASEKTSTTAASAAVISDSAIADDAEITIDIDQIGSTVAGKGLKVTLIGTRA